MQLDNYTPFHYGKKSHSLQNVLIRHFEPILLGLLAIVGIFGSLYLIGYNIGKNTEGGKLPEYAAITSILNVSEKDEFSSGDFDYYVKMNSKAMAGEVIIIDFLQDHSASRYVMEMGNGERLIVTQNNLIYTYEEPGKYVIELKEIRRGLLHLVGTKKIRIK